MQTQRELHKRRTEAPQAFKGLRDQCEGIFREKGRGGFSTEETVINFRHASPIYMTL